MDAVGFINYYDPSQPISPVNPAPTNIPSFGNGLALMPNISGGTLSPTFYAVSAGTYWYWSGSAWTNTGHSTGNGSALNIAGCGSTIYNLVGTTGQVYTYNGTGPGTLLTTLAGFNGGGPYDLVTDCNCNFYALNTTVPNQGLSMYNSAGVLQCTYTLSGMPNISSGGGFAIIGNMIYVKNSGFYIGNITTSGVTFTAVSSFTNTPTDFASCSVCYSTANFSAATIAGGAIDCSSPSATLAVTTTVNPVNYQWIGPGAVGSVNGPTVIVNAPGTYSCILSTLGCPPAQITLTTSVVSNSVLVPALITPSGNICAGSNVITQLSVTYTSTNATITWNGPGLNVSGSSSVNVGAPGAYTVSVKDIPSGCTGTDVVTINQTPTVNIALSGNTLCGQSYNGSPSTITVSPSGATNYTLITSGNFSTSTPNATVMNCSAASLSGGPFSIASLTLIGSSSGCADTTVASLTIIHNPTLAFSNPSSSICPGESATISVIGATQYTWGGATGLNTNSGNSVIASPAVSSIYTVSGTSFGCSSQTQTLSVVVLPIPTVSITPANSTICLGSALTLSTIGTATLFSWSPGTYISALSGSTVSVAPLNGIVYSVIGSLNSCTNSASATVNVVAPPVVSMNLSSHSVCARNYNNSPNAITVTPSGATSYTLQSTSGITVISPGGPTMQAIANGPLFPIPTIANLQLIGKTGVCTVMTSQTLAVIPNPVVAVSPASGSICPGDKHAFSASGGQTYTWLPMPNYTLTGNNSIVANPTLTSFYSVLGSEKGCNSDVKNAVLVLLTVPDVSVSANSQTLCSGSSVALSAIGNAASYQWFPSVGLSSSVGSQVYASPFSMQTYVVKATLNTCTNQAVTTLSVIEIPSVFAGATQSIVCADASTSLKAYGADSFLWFPNEHLNSPSGNMVIATPNQNTTYTVHGYNGICTGSTTVQVKTVTRPDMDLNASGNQVCLGSAVTISVSGAQNYTWIPAAGLIPAGSNTRVIVAPQESTNYTVVGANSLGTVSCYQQLNYLVMVTPLIKPVVTKNVEICEGDRTTLSAKGGNTYSWTPDYGLNITNGAGVVARPNMTTVYTVEVSDNSYCGQTTTVMVTVNPRPEVIAGRDTSYNLNDAIFITAKSTATINWVRGEGINCVSCAETQVYPGRNTCYVVEATNDFGCIASDEVCIELTEDFTAYIPNTFTPNGDGMNDMFLIYGENISNVSMEIYDRWGTRLFYSDNFATGWDGHYKSVLCPAGVYTYVINYTGLNRKKYTKTGSVTIIE